MEPYLAFLAEHWLLSTAFVAVIILLLLNEWRHRSFGVAQVSPQELVNLLNHEGAIVVDIRSKDSFELGHILGAMNVPHNEAQNRVVSLNKFKNKPLIIVGTMKEDAPKVARLFIANGFEKLYYLAGGIDAWHAQGLPVVKK